MFIVTSLVSAILMVVGAITSLSNIFGDGAVNLPLVVFGGVLFAVALCTLWLSVVQVIKNYFVELHTYVKREEAEIGVLEKQYEDLEKKLEVLVEKYFSHETGLLDAVKERSAEKLSALFENYPELKAMGGTKELIDKIVRLRMNISNAQISFNRSARAYNEYAQKSPYNKYVPEEMDKKINYIDLKE
ncbi:hypothetical protein C0583_01920 [Candidatus Parcubacteria bacterium]|nr:MAG: hypothetical protein C0583_01920 [Candidatus Parcubacteria bacterium]